MRVSKVSKQDILEAARLAFQRHGLRAVRIDDLARDLGISKKTLYLHFESKEALVREVVVNTAEAMFAQVELNLQQKGSALHKLEALFSQVQSFVRSLPPGAPLDLARLYPEVLAEVMQRRHHFLTRYLTLIEQGQQAGEIRDDFPPSMLTQAVLAIVETVGTPAFVERSGLELGDVIQMLRAIFLGGLSARAQEVSSCDAPPR
ncbi:MAG: TetR/AcrR family transcriptional regulator [Pseudomonadota bacterium]